MKNLSIRTKADYECERVKTILKSTSLNYFCQESPFGLKICLKKSFIKDFSTDQLSSTPTQIYVPDLYQSSPAQEYQCELDSGLNECKCSETEKQMKEVRTELVKTVIETNEQISNLKKEIDTKDKIILNLNSKVKLVTEEKNKIKDEFEAKNKQLKNKNKDLDNLKTKLDKNSKETEVIRNNFKHKIDSLEYKMEKLKLEKEEKEKKLKSELTQLKKPNKKTKHVQTQTNVLKEHVESQTEIVETHSISTSPLFTKLHIEGKPSHDVTCLCLCHDDQNTPEICQVQLFAHTTDTDEALETLYYKDEYDYDNWDDNGDDRNVESEMEFSINKDVAMMKIVENIVRKDENIWNILLGIYDALADEDGDEMENDEQPEEL